MRIAFYSSAPLTDKRNWSGTMFKMYEQMLIHGHEVFWIPQIKLTASEEKKLNTIAKFSEKIFNRGYNRIVNIYKAKVLARKIKAVLDEKKFDFIFAPTAVTDFAFVTTKIPIIYLNDANVYQLLNYYPYYSGFGKLSKMETEYVEKKMLQNSTINIFSSDWASDFAVSHYKIPKDKVKTIKFGANLIIPEKMNYDKGTNEFTFLFLAVNWDRKRGKLAYESLKILHNKGFPVKMLIIGCNPDIDDTWVKIIPFLNKNNADEFKELQSYLQQSHFLFVPTEADCTPIAFCEAAGYGLPVISTNTGGVSAHVEDGKTGILLSQNSAPEDYALAIETLIKNPSLIKKMSVASSRKYEDELNWEKWGNVFNKIIMQLHNEK